MEKLDWDRIEKLRGPNSLSAALRHLGIFRLNLVRKELRNDGDRVWISVPVWLKANHPFIYRIEKNEVGAEILRKTRDEVREESHRLQDTVIKTNSLGLSEVGIPLVLRGEKIGFITMGGFSLESIPSEVVMEERLKVLMLSEEEKKHALEEWKNLPSFSPDKRLIVIQMLELIVREVVQFFEETISAREREESVHRYTFSQMVTSHAPLRSMLKRMNQFAVEESPILIFGEPGTGRELLANLVHDQSKRKDKAFKSLHCSSVAENMLEAELMGFEKGAFLGAYATKPGLLEICSGGTLYLKEVADLSLSMQHKLLRVIQDQSFLRLGGTESIRTNVRIIASTQRNLKKLVQVGAFREELYFRLNVVELELPALRQRKEDIALLAEHFLKYFTPKMKKEGIQWKDEAILKLSSYSFPGNVRELKNEVERLIALKESHSFIEVRDLNSKILESRTPIEEIEKGQTLKSLVDEYERQIISEALQKYHWNKSRVAELFQITRQGLLKKISKYKLDKRKRV